MRRLSSTRILINGRRPTTPLPPTPATKSSLLWLGVRPWLDPFFPPAADIHMYHTYLQMYHTYINKCCDLLLIVLLVDSELRLS